MKGTLSFKEGVMIGLAGFISIAVILGVVAYNQGWLSGVTAGIGGELGKYQQCTYGSALITNNPEGLSCWDVGSGEVAFNYTAINSSDKDFGHGYLTITADGGCLSYITVTAKPNNTNILSVKGASPNENFEDSDYENWPVPPDYLEEGESVTYEYWPTVKATNWDVKLPNDTVAVLRLHVDIPEEGEIVPGCNRDVGDGVCEKDIEVPFRHLGWNCPTGILGGPNITNVTGNCFRGDVTVTRFCSLNASCAFQNVTAQSYIGGPSACY